MKERRGPQGRYRKAENICSRLVMTALKESAFMRKVVSLSLFTGNSRVLLFALPQRLTIFVRLHIRAPLSTLSIVNF